MAATAEQVLAELELVRGYFPCEAIEAAVRLGPVVADALIASIERATREGRGLQDDYVLHLCAMHVLAEQRERRAYRPIAAMCRLSERDLDSLIGVVVTESLPHVLAAVAQDDDGLLRELIEDPAVDQWVRAGALHAIACCVVEGALPQERFLTYFRQLWNGERIDRQHNAVWDEMACIATDLGLAEFLGDIETAFDDGLISSLMIGRQEVVDELTAPLHRFRCSMPGKYAYLRSAAAELGRWPNMWRGSDEGDNPFLRQPWRRGAKVGRNDPCPCGSGKKFKKCCLLRSGGRESAME